MIRWGIHDERCRRGFNLGRAARHGNYASASRCESRRVVQKHEAVLSSFEVSMWSVRISPEDLACLLGFAAITCCSDHGHRTGLDSHAINFPSLHIFPRSLAGHQVVVRAVPSPLTNATRGLVLVTTDVEVDRDFMGNLP